MSADAAGTLTESLFGDLHGEARAEAGRLVGELVADWLRDPDGIDEDDLIEIGSDDLAAALRAGGGSDGEARLARLREIVFDRRVEQVAGDALRLAIAVTDDEVSDAEARDGAAALRARVDELLGALDDVTDGDRLRRLRRHLADADLDARWIEAGRDGATSHRLGHHLHG